MSSTDSSSSDDSEIEQVSFSSSKLVILAQDLKRKEALNLQKNRIRKLQDKNKTQKKVVKEVAVVEEEEELEDVKVETNPIVSNLKISVFKKLKVPFNKELLYLRSQKLGLQKRKAPLKYKKFC